MGFLNIIYISVAFLYGLIFGSFYNVCIYRIPNGKSIISPPSACGSCGHRLSGLDMIPVVSWLLLGRKCRYCKAKIPYRYPLVELLTGLLFAAAIYSFGITIEALLAVIFVSLLIIISFIDIDTRLIYDRFNLLIFLTGILAYFLVGRHSLLEALAGFALGGITLLVIDLAGRLIFKKEGIGFGDVKLMFASGLFLGFSQTAFALLCAIWSAAIVGVTTIRVRMDKTDRYIPFGPFLALGCAISLFFGEGIISWYLSFLGL